jgi:hypothetical protein
VERSLADTRDVVVARINAGSVDERFEHVLHVIVYAARNALLSFAGSARSLAKDGSAEPAVERFVPLLLDRDAALASLRVVQWAYVSRIVAKNWGEQYDETIGVANTALGIENDYERRVAHFGTFAGTKKEYETKSAEFNLLVVDGLIGAAVGDGFQTADGTLLGAVWGGHFVDGLSYFDAVMEAIATSPD